MTLPAPDRLIQRLSLRNRLDLWRAAPAEHLFQLAAALALLAVLLWASRNALTRIAQFRPADPQILLAAAILLVAQLLASRHDRNRAQERLHSGWLAASPWPQRGRQQAVRRQVLGYCGARLVLVWAVILVLLALREAAPPVLLLPTLGLLTLLAPVSTWLLARQTPAATTQPATRLEPAIAAVPLELTGLRLLHHGWRAPPLQSQRLQASLALLLLPGGISGVVGIVLLGAVLALLWAGRCYTHYRDSCFAATRWLAATVLSSARLAGALVPPLAGRLALVLSLLTAACALAGIAWWVLAAVALLALALVSLNAALVLVHRAQPRQYPLAAMVQTLLIVLLSQTLLPLAILLWLGLLLRALVHIRRPSRLHRS